MKILNKFAYFSVLCICVNLVMLLALLFLPFFIAIIDFILPIFSISLQPVETSIVQQDFLSVNSSHAGETQSNNPLPTPPTVDEECESMDSTNSNDGEPAPPNSDGPQCVYPVVYPAYVAPFFPFSIPFYSGYSAETTNKEETHEVLKPTAVHSKSPLNVDELIGMSKLSLGESIGHAGPSSLSLQLLEGSSRRSAFHANPASGSENMNSGGSPIHAV